MGFIGIGYGSLDAPFTQKAPDRGLKIYKNNIRSPCPTPGYYTSEHLFLRSRACPPVSTILQRADTRNSSLLTRYCPSLPLPSQPGPSGNTGCPCWEARLPRARQTHFGHPVLRLHAVILTAYRSGNYYSHRSRCRPRGCYLCLSGFPR